MKEWYVYIVRCSDGSLYCGVALDVEERVCKHNAAKGAKYTRSRLPVTLLGCSKPMEKGKALSLEHWIKAAPPQRKLDILQNNGTPI